MRNGTLPHNPSHRRTHTHTHTITHSLTYACKHLHRYSYAHTHSHALIILTSLSLSFSLSFHHWSLTHPLAHSDRWASTVCDASTAKCLCLREQFCWWSSEPCPSLPACGHHKCDLPVVQRFSSGVLRNGWSSYRNADSIQHHRGRVCQWGGCELLLYCHQDDWQGQIPGIC